MRRVFLAGLLLLLLFCWGCPISSAQQRSECDKIVSVWETIKPYPYVWGGESVDEGGFDCSGAIYHVQKKISRPVPRTTAHKYFIMAGGEKKHWSEAGCGDWVWWQFKPDRPYGHIGMHVEQPRAWQSGSSTGPTEIEFFDGGFWAGKFKVSKCPNIQK